MDEEQVSLGEPLTKTATAPEGLVVGLMRGDGTIEPYLILDKAGHAEFTGAFGSKQTADFVVRNLENYVQKTILDKLEAHCQASTSLAGAEQNVAVAAAREEAQAAAQTSLIAFGLSALIGLVLIATTLVRIARSREP